ncbi:hypothetical protein [Rhodococcus rhodnii]|uniref:hypothetical protein n=1 Tax=Rhodococcus rhodnii TaxID=38312 RepID=UPI000906EA54|nr:hypothetical protein [Rhodococcus rhodnii]
MSRRAAAFNRLVVLVLALVLLGAGAYAFAWYIGVPRIREWVGRYDREAVDAAATQSWWVWALAGTLAASLVLALAVLVVDLTRRRPESVTVGDAADGSATLDLPALADGLAEQLRAYPGVRRVRAHAMVDRGLPTLELTVTADAEIDVVGFTSTAEAVARGSNVMLPGSRVATRVLLHLEPPTPDEGPVPSLPAHQEAGAAS